MALAEALLLAVLAGVVKMVSLRGGAMLAKQRTHPCWLAPMAEAEDTACRARRSCRMTWRGGVMFIVPRGVGCPCSCACDEERQRRVEKACVRLRQRQEDSLLVRKRVGGGSDGRMSHLLRKEQDKRTKLA